MADPTRYYLVGQYRDGERRLGAQLRDVELDGSMWGVWPDIIRALDLRYLAGGRTMGYIAVKNNSVVGWDIREPYRTDEYQAVHPDA